MSTTIPTMSHKQQYQPCLTKSVSFLIAKAGVPSSFRKYILCPYELEVVFFLEPEAFVEATMVNFDETFVDKNACFGMVLVMSTQSMSVVEDSISDSS